MISSVSLLTGRPDRSNYPTVSGTADASQAASSGGPVLSSRGVGTIWRAKPTPCAFGLRRRMERLIDALGHEPEIATTIIAPANRQHSTGLNVCPKAPLMRSGPLAPHASALLPTTRSLAPEVRQSVIVSGVRCDECS